MTNTTRKKGRETTQQTKDGRKNQKLQQIRGEFYLKGGNSLINLGSSFFPLCKSLLLRRRRRSLSCCIDYTEFSPFLFLLKTANPGPSLFMTALLVSTQTMVPSTGLEGSFQWHRYSIVMQQDWWISLVEVVSLHDTCSVQ